MVNIFRGGGGGIGGSLKKRKLRRGGDRGRWGGGGGLSDRLDCVVMGYYRGKGKRTGFGLGAFLVGVRKGDQFLTIAKIGTGLSDAQWRELKTRITNYD